MEKNEKNKEEIGNWNFLLYRYDSFELQPVNNYIYGYILYYMSLENALQFVCNYLFISYNSEEKINAN